MDGAQGGEPKEGSFAPAVVMGVMGLCCLGPLVLPPLLGLVGATGFAGGSGWSVGALVLGVALLGGGLGCLVHGARRRAIGGGGYCKPEARVEPHRVAGGHAT